VARHDIIVIGASAGGVEAMQKLARDLPPDLPASLFVVLHMPPFLKTVLPEILTRSGRLAAEEAADGLPIEEGHIYVARPGSHLLVDRGRVRVSRGPKENGYLPSIDVLFRSAARAYGPRVIAVVLSGLLDDGAAGALAVKQRGGLLVVQAPEDATFPDMPRAALRTVGTADYSAPLAEMAMLLSMLSRTSAPEEERFPVPLEMQVEDEIAHGAESDAQVASILGEPSTFSCPECGGVLWDLSAQELQRFRCQVGHAYSAVHLFHAQEEALQQQLWAAARGLREHALLARQVQRSSAGHGWPSVADRFLETSVQAEEGATLLTTLLETLGRPEEETTKAFRPEAAPVPATRQTNQTIEEKS
jgi:two-component system, chemotaxis family, protein-glutamate methylesterase/glutaminase